MEYTFLSKNVSIKKVSEEQASGVFEISGLYTGYGVTLGNALRRVLLSSLPGAAITQIKIKGVKHEFSTMPDVMEDIIDITLNMKKVRFKFFTDEPQILSLRKKGLGPITAGDIKVNSEVEVVDPDVHIATLTSKNAEMDMEIVVEKGLGYSPVETRKMEKLSIGSIAIDAIFTPVVNVNFDVENMRVGDKTDFNKLILTIKTDGTISPSRALHKAANILKDHIDIVSGIETSDEFEGKVKKESAKETKTEKKTKKTKK
ncbi:MAG: DNA-directed RNA polymerase subunit alpha [Candidatus Paceibacterota bacterium]|jgi:DNA-directed RNA polymerase subunit alpha